MSREQTAAAVADYGDLVLKVAWRILPDAEETKDVFQETFLQYHRFLAGGEIKHPKAWLCRTAQNTAFKRLRQRRREVQVDNAAELGQTEGGKEVEQHNHHNDCYCSTYRQNDKISKYFSQDF